MASIVSYCGAFYINATLSDNRALLFLYNKALTVRLVFTIRSDVLYQCYVAASKVFLGKNYFHYRKII